MKFLDFAFMGKQKNILIYLLVFVGLFIFLMGAVDPLVTWGISLFEEAPPPVTLDKLSALENQAGGGSKYDRFVMLFSFFVAILVAFYIIPFIHKRKFITFNTGRRKFSFKRYFVGVLVALVVYYGGFSIEYFFTDHNYVYNFDLKGLLMGLPIALLMIPIQTYSEEFFFRGYLTQGVTTATKNTLAAILLPSVVFAVMHGINPEVSKYGIVNVVGSIFVTGLTYSIISILDDGIELSSGMHAFNNISAMLFIGTETSVLGDTKPIFTTDSVGDYVMLITIVQSAAMILILYFIFKWKDLSKLVHHYSKEEIESINIS